MNKVEFRLYYDDKGDAICYTCEELEGTYIVITAQEYAEGRPDVKVIDGRLVHKSSSIIITKLVKSVTGTKCADTDVSVIVKDEPSTIWSEKIYEYGYN